MAVSPPAPVVARPAETPPTHSTAPRAGADLRAARERLDWPLEQVADALHIRRPHLEALEVGRIDLLPGNADAVGFLRTYARALGLDPDEIVHRFKVEASEVNHPPQTFATEADRARLTPAALQALLGLARAWKLTSQEAADLIGVSVSTWERIRAQTWKQSLSQDQFMRASAMIGIYKGLHLLFSDGMADRWMRLRNTGPLFSNRTPIEAMRDEGIPGMLDIRHYIDALRGGL